MARAPRSARPRFIAKREGRRFELRDDRLVDTKRNELYPWGLPDHETVEFGTPGRPSSGGGAGTPVDGPLRFTPDGLPADDASAQALASEVEPWLFVIDGRLRSASSAPPTTDDPKDWEQFLRRLGFGDPDSRFDQLPVCRDLEALEASRARRRSGRPVRDGARSSSAVSARSMSPAGLGNPESKPASVFTCSARRWHEMLTSRVATLFDCAREDHIVADLVDRLLEGNVSTQTLPEPLRAILAKHPYRRRCFEVLWSTCFRRRQLAGSRTSSRAPIIVEFRYDRKLWRFVIPKRHPLESDATHRHAVRSLKVLHAARFAIACRIQDRDLVAAAMWSGQQFLVAQPATSRHRSLAAVCRELNAKGGRARRLVIEIDREFPWTEPALRRLLSRRGGRPTAAEQRRQEDARYRALGARLTEAELRRELGGGDAFAMLEKANLIEFGFTYRRDLPVPSDRAVRRAQTLRRRALRDLDRVRIAYGRRVAGKPAGARSPRRS